MQTLSVGDRVRKTSLKDLEGTVKIVKPVPSWSPGNPLMMIGVKWDDGKESFEPQRDLEKVETS